MGTPAPDERSAKYRELDKEIASEPQLPPLDVSPHACTSPVEVHLDRFTQHPAAFLGVVENGLVRVIDPDVRLPEQARVIIVANNPGGRSQDDVA